MTQHRKSTRQSLLELAIGGTAAVTQNWGRETGVWIPPAGCLAWRVNWGSLAGAPSHGGEAAGPGRLLRRRPHLSFYGSLALKELHVRCNSKNDSDDGSAWKQINVHFLQTKSGLDSSSDFASLSAGFFRTGGHEVHSRLAPSAVSRRTGPSRSKTRPTVFGYDTGT